MIRPIFKSQIEKISNQKKHCPYKPGSVLAEASACHLSTTHVAMRL